MHNQMSVFDSRYNVANCITNILEAQLVFNVVGYCICLSSVVSVESEVK